MDRRYNIMDVIGNKVDTMALKAGINVNVNDCKNNIYKILLKQVVALENVLEVKTVLKGWINV